MLLVEDSETEFDDILFIYLVDFIKKNRNNRKVKSLIKKGSLFNVSDEIGNSLLHYAAENNNKDITQYLIKSGSKVDAQNARGKTPLLLAVEKKHKRIVKILLKAGANFDISDDSHNNALQASANYFDSRGIADSIVVLFYNQLCKVCHHWGEMAFRLLNAGWPIYLIIKLECPGITMSILEVECSFLFYLFNEYTLRAIIQLQADILTWERQVNILILDNVRQLLQNISRKTLQIFPTRGLNVISRSEREESLSEPMTAVLEQVPLLADYKIIPPEHFMIHRQLQRENIQDAVRSECNVMVDLERMREEWQDILLNRPRNNVLSWETQYAVACVVDYIVNDGTGLKQAEERKHAYFLKSKSSAICEETFEKLDLIYQFILKNNFFIFGELLLAHLALQECSGTPITECVRSAINSGERLKNYFGFCQRLLAKEVYGSVTLFQLLSENIINLVHLVDNQEIADATTCLNERLKLESYYFHILLQRRIERAFGSNVLCKLMHIDYKNFSNVADTIFDYLTQKDRHALLELHLRLLRPHSKILRWFCH